MSKVPPKRVIFICNSLGFYEPNFFPSDRGWGCSWNSRGVAIPPMDDEHQIFDRLFGEEDLSAKRQQIKNDQHVVACLYRDMAHLNQFLLELDQIEEGDGSLLDHTTVVVGSNFGDSSNHTCNNLPTIVVGGGYRHQAHTVLEKPTPLCNIYLELLHQHNIDVGSFGSSTKDMKLLKG